jgi:hypothetical protein
MDLMRSAYSVTMQFDQAGEILVPVEWYLCSDDAGYFPTPHLFGSGNYANKANDLFGIGEYWASARPWRNGSQPFFAPGSGAFCGPTDWFQLGCPSDAPPLEYSSAGVPVCCPQPPCQSWYLFPSSRAVQQIAPVSETWVVQEDLETNHIESSPSVFGLFVHYEGGSGVCGAGTQTGCFLAGSPPLPVFEANGMCIAYDPVAMVGTWTFPTAPSPYDLVQLQFTCTNGP